MIKNKLLEIRLQLGYKFQKDFADFLDMEQQDYNRIENNKKQVSLETALLIARKIHRPVEEIFKLE